MSVELSVWELTIHALKLADSLISIAGTESGSSLAGQTAAKLYLRGPQHMYALV